MLLQPLPLMKLVSSWLPSYSTCNQTQWLVVLFIQSFLLLCQHCCCYHYHQVVLLPLRLFLIVIILLRCVVVIFIMSDGVIFCVLTMFAGSLCRLTTKRCLILCRWKLSFSRRDRFVSVLSGSLERWSCWVIGRRSDIHLMPINSAITWSRILICSWCMAVHIWTTDNKTTMWLGFCSLEAALTAFTCE